MDHIDKKDGHSSNELTDKKVFNTQNRYSNKGVIFYVVMIIVFSVAFLVTGYFSADLCIYMFKTKSFDYELIFFTSLLGTLALLIRYFANHLKEERIRQTKFNLEFKQNSTTTENSKKGKTIDLSNSSELNDNIT